jgi:hypothetical protein
MAIVGRSATKEILDDEPGDSKTRNAGTASSGLPNSLLFAISNPLLMKSLG